MGHDRRFLKVISIVQVVMGAIFLALGIVDRYEVRFIYTSFLFAPCWIAALVSTLGSCPSLRSCLNVILKQTKLGRLELSFD